MVALYYNDRTQVWETTNEKFVEVAPGALVVCWNCGTNFYRVSDLDICCDRVELVPIPQEEILPKTMAKP